MSRFFRTTVSNGLCFNFRRQRSHTLARSQPNLLSIDDDDDDGGQIADRQTADENGIAQPTSLPTHYSSNPNLTDTQQYQTKLFSFNKVRNFFLNFFIAINPFDFTKGLPQTFFVD